MASTTKPYGFIKWRSRYSKSLGDDEGIHIIDLHEAYVNCADDEYVDNHDHDDDSDHDTDNTDDETDDAALGL